MARAFKRLNTWWLAYEYKHTTLALTALVLFVLLIDSALLVSVIRVVDEFGYVSGLLAGALSVSFFTAAPALVLTVELAQHLNPFLLAFLVAIGSVAGDWLIIKFFEERIFTELAPVIKKLKLRRIKQALSRPYGKWVLVVIGAAVVSSPLPDEVGLALMGVGHHKRYIVLTICFVLNFIGAFLVISAAKTWL
jgi:membrane protein YqaA with SNARE-associated domain